MRLAPVGVSLLAGYCDEGASGACSADTRSAALDMASLALLRVCIGAEHVCSPHELKLKICIMERKSRLDLKATQQQQSLFFLINCAPSHIYCEHFCVSSTTSSAYVFRSFK